ncbi:MAG: PAS domain S-box protein, partial [Phycisphaerae bacterium]|nr:PAS domain S-box protein [Phycisphaerae bacterium]
MQNVRLRRSLTDYGLAVGATLLACAAQLAMQRLPGEPPPYIAFYPALMIAALQGGLGPGLLATGVAALLAGWLILPVAGGAVSLALFSGVGLFICIVAELYRRRRDRALRDSELSAQAELARAAEALRSSQDMLRESLAASEQRLRLATQSGQIGVQEIDLATGEARLDELTARMLGIKPGERLTMERYVQEFLHPEDAVHLLPQFLKWLESNEDHWGAEYRIRRPDGEERWIQDDYLAIRDESGKPLRAIGVSSDITRHKRAEQALRQSKEMLRLVLDTVPVRVFWKDLNGVFLGCNQHFARDAGLESPDEIIGRDDYAMGWRDQARLYRADDQAIMQSGQAKLGYEEPQTAPNGQLLWLRTSKIPLRGPDGKVFGVLGTYEDITERKRAELTLRESEERFKALAAATFEGIVIEEGGRLVDAN